MFIKEVYTMKTFILYSIVILLTSCTTPASSDMVLSTLTDDKYTSVTEAVIGATNAHNVRSIEEDREAVGAIINQDGVFRYSVAFGGESQSTVSVRFRIPQNSFIVAYWHTHGAAGKARTIFSKIDADLANNDDLPVYMAAHDGILRLYSPGDTRLSRRHAVAMGIGPENAGAALGTVVTDATGYPVQINVK